MTQTRVKGELRKRGLTEVKEGKKDERENGAQKWEKKKRQSEKKQNQ
jgi:hypothetical protein